MPFCTFCQCKVPDGDEAWEDHIRGKKHLQKVVANTPKTETLANQNSSVNPCSTGEWQTVERKRRKKKTPDWWDSDAWEIERYDRERKKDQGIKRPKPVQLPSQTSKNDGIQLTELNVSNEKFWEPVPKPSEQQTKEEIDKAIALSLVEKENEMELAISMSLQEQAQMDEQEDIQLQYLLAHTWGNSEITPDDLPDDEEDYIMDDEEFDADEF